MFEWFVIEPFSSTWLPSRLASPVLNECCLVSRLFFAIVISEFCEISIVNFLKTTIGW